MQCKLQVGSDIFTVPIGGDCSINNPVVDGVINVGIKNSKFFFDLINYCGEESTIPFPPAFEDVACIYISHLRNDMDVIYDVEQLRRCFELCHLIDDSEFFKVCVKHLYYIPDETNDMIDKLHPDIQRDIYSCELEVNFSLSNVTKIIIPTPKLLYYKIYYRTIARYNNITSIESNPLHYENYWNPAGIVYILENCTSLKAIILDGLIGTSRRLTAGELVTIAHGFSKNRSVTHINLENTWINAYSVMFLLQQIKSNPNSMVKYINLGVAPTLSMQEIEAIKNYAQNIQVHIG